MPGLKFYKLDLHTHTPASKCYLDKTHTPEQIIEAALAKSLSAIAITDHNTAAWIDRMQQAAAGTGLTIFPGVEISMSEGYHLVALFDPTVNQQHVESFLGAIDIKPADYGQQEAVCTKGIYFVIDKIIERDGLAIFAHIDTSKGAFFEGAKNEDGKLRVPVTVKKLFNEANYHAVEVTQGCLPDGYDKAHDFKRFPALYEASDNPDTAEPKKHSADGLASRYSWFKLDQVDLEGLRQCFADPEVRIRLAGQYHVSGCPKILSLQVGGEGFLRNQQFTFHEGLNSIIGGKGVGKSLAIEFLRFGLCQPPGDENLLSDHHGKLEKRLGIGNKIQVEYQTADGTRYRMERELVGIRKGGRADTIETCTNLETGEVYRGDIRTLLPILAYSQTEVIKIAENKNAQLLLIDRFIDPRPHELIITELRHQLEQNDRRFHEAIMARDRLDGLQMELDTLNVRITTINRALNNPLFESMKQAEAKKALFNQRYGYVEAMIEQVREWNEHIKEDPLEELPVSQAEASDLQQAQALADQARILASQYLAKLAEELTLRKASISDVIMAWMPEYDQIESGYKKLLKEIGGDRESQESQRRQLESQKTDYERQIRQAQAQVREMEGMIAERNTLLDQLERAYFQYFETRSSKYEHLSELSDGKLRLHLDHAMDRTTYEERLVELLKGGASPISTGDRRKIAQNILPRRLVQLVLDRNAVHLANEAEISETWANRVIEKLWASDDFGAVLAIQHNCFPGDVPSIRFRKDSRTYDELSELSIGQKCTALLIIALCDGAMPVVIDQPEDALDIASVWEDIAKKLRRGKETRQFILTTHNSSLAVGSDSDQFIVLIAGAITGKVAYTGAIDRPDVRQSVIEHLEGGDEPYKLRAIKYNIHQ